EATFADVAHLVKGADGRTALETGDVDAGLVWAGQIQGLIHDVPSCAELLERIVSEARSIIDQRLPQFTA
ncbi:MAG: nitronate monooxygenase, partial [Spongiibacter sp.]